VTSTCHASRVKGYQALPLLTVLHHRAGGEPGNEASAVHSCHCYTPLVKISHQMGTTRIGITRA